MSPYMRQSKKGATGSKSDLNQPMNNRSAHGFNSDENNGPRCFRHQMKQAMDAINSQKTKHGIKAMLPESEAINRMISGYAADV